MVSAFFFSVITLILEILSMYKFVVIIAALLSWVKPDPSNPIVQILFKLTEPLYIWMRKKINPVVVGIDLSPLFVVLVIMLVETLFVNIRYMF